MICIDILRISLIFSILIGERKKIAKNGRDFYLRYINSTIVADFILSKTLDIKSKNNFVWER